MSEPGTAVERVEQGSAVALTDRDIKSIEFQARTIAVLDNRIKKIKDPEERKETAIGLAITLYNYGLPITVTNAKKLHLIRGEVMESAQLLIGLLAARGHEIRVIEEGDERAVVRGWRHGAGEPHSVTYTIDQARRSGALDEWVERWSKSGSDFKLEEKLVIRRDGEDYGERPLPQWAEEQIKRGRVKSFEAWASYRSDMLVNRAIRRLAKRMGGDALLGVGALEDDEPGERVSPPLPPQAETPTQEEDDDIEDAVVVGEEEDEEPADEPEPATDEEPPPPPPPTDEPAGYKPDDPQRPFL